MFLRLKSPRVGTDLTPKPRQLDDAGVRLQLKIWAEGEASSPVSNPTAAASSEVSSVGKI